MRATMILTAQKGTLRRSVAALFDFALLSFRKARTSSNRGCGCSMISLEP